MALCQRHRGFASGTVAELQTRRYHGLLVAAFQPPVGRTLLVAKLDETTPVWTCSCVDAQIEKRIRMEPGANTTYVRYARLRGSAPATLALKAAMNDRDFHANTHAGGSRMAVDVIPQGLRVTAYDGARPFTLLAEGTAVEPAHEWRRQSPRRDPQDCAGAACLRHRGLPSGTMRSAP